MKHIYIFTFIFLTSILLLHSENWEKLDGPSGGKVIDLVYAEGSAVALVQNDLHSSIYISSDQGDNWELLLDSWKGDKWFYSISYQNGVLFAGTNRGDLARSTDMGNSWESASTDLINDLDSSERITHLAASSELMVLGTLRGRVFSSIDSGKSWKELRGFPATRISDMAFHDGALYISLNTVGVWKTEDEGETWTEFNSGLDFSNSVVNELKSLGGRFFALGGNMRAVLDEDNLEWELIKGLEFPQNKIGFDGEFYFIPAFKKIYRTKDLNNWEEIGKASSYGSEICFLNLNGTLLAGNNLTGVYRTTNSGNSWQKASHGITCTSIKTIFADKDGSIYTSWIAADFGFPFISSDKGESWDDINNGISVIGTKDIIAKDGFLFAGTEGSGVFRSSNKGKLWKSKSDGIIGGYISRLTATENYIFVGTIGFSQGVFRSSDFGESWESVEGLSKSDTEDLIYDERSQKLYANVKNLQGVFVSEDEGDTWTNLFDPFENEKAWISCIDARGPLIVLGSLNNGLFISTDGKNFTNTMDFKDDNITDLKIIDNYIYIALQNGKIYRRDINSDSPKNYEMYEGLPTVSYVTNLEFDGKYLFAGTHGLGLWRYDISEFLNSTNAESNIHNPLNIYPNPFNDNFTISLENFEKGSVNISLFNSEGATVFSKEILSEDGVIRIDDINVISGIYILKIKTEAEVSYRKLIKVK